jgi:hypothetical protein
MPGKANAPAPLQKPGRRRVGTIGNIWQLQSSHTSPARTMRGNTMGQDKIRIPMDYPAAELLNVRINRLFAFEVLSDYEAGLLCKKRRELKKADRRLARVLGTQSLPAVDVRPLYFDGCSHSILGSHNQIELCAGWIFRLSEYIERLEIKYGVKGNIILDGERF